MLGHDTGAAAVARISSRFRDIIEEMADEPKSVFPGFSDFVDRLVEERLALGLSQTEVAARMGTSQSAVARLERGDADVRLSTLQRYAAALERRVGFDLADRVQPGGDHS
jgi:ribosome-binding protein aMBF1 (putative translation factor)